MTTAVCLDSQGQASGSSGSISEAVGAAPRGLGAALLGEQQSAEVELISVLLALEVGAVRPQEELRAPGTHRAVCCWCWDTGRQGLGGWLPHQQAEGGGGSLALCRPPGGYVPAAECRWADSWPGAAEQLGCRSV